MYKKARRFLRFFRFYRLLHGSIVSVKDLNTDNLLPHEVKWLDQDRKQLVSSPNVFSSIPATIDLLVLDGGEFSSLAEFDLLRDRLSGWIILDDTFTRKNSSVYRLLASDEEWLEVYSSSERNGVSVFSRIIEALI
jgi:hypothetical protein